MLISRIFKSNNRLVFVKFDKKSSEATFCPFNKYENFDLYRDVIELCRT